MDKAENNFFMIKIKLKIEKNNEIYNARYVLNEEKEKTFEEIYKDIKTLYDSIQSIQKNAYLSNYCTNFIYGNLFQMMHDYLLKNEINSDVKYFLYSLFGNENIKIKERNKIIQDINLKNNFDLKIYEKFINDCHDLIIQIIKENGLTINDLLKKNLLKNEFNKNIGVYINGCSNLEKEIIQYYIFFTNNLPLASTLLLCNENTTSEEIISFLYRAILCDQHICFCIARAESLSEENKTLIINMLKEIIDENNIKMKSCLIFMSKNLEDGLCKSLFKIKFVKQFENISLKIIEKIKIVDENIKIVSSDASGVGKSEYIKTKAKNKYIYFPVGGIFSKEEILERLKKLDNEKQINNENDLLLHVDLYDTEQKSLMNDLLYFILVTKSFVKDNNIFYLSRKIKIFLELPHNFIKKFPILNVVDEKSMIKLEINNLPHLIVPDDILSNVRIVSLFLKLLKEENKLKEGVSEIFKAKNKIDKNQIKFPGSDKDLILEGEEFDYSKIVINAEDENKELTREKCENLIKEAIKSIEKPTYYQINTFINFLANQLIQFNKNFYLSACTFIDSDKLNYCEFRSMIVNKFIELSRYFTKGAFTQLIKEQENFNNSNKIPEEYEHESISFYKMDLAFVFFYGGNKSNGLCIITNKKPDDPEYKKLYKLLNYQTYDNITVNKAKSKLNKNSTLLSVKPLNDYKSFKQHQYLEEIANILDLTNPIFKMDNKSELKSLEEIADDYVFTPDNFIKICFILIRIRANIPIIMMGETGCGKTSLIRKISELQNNGKHRLIIKNIHAGHTNKDIIDFIENEVLPEAKKLKLEEEKRKELYKFGTHFEEKKLYVFFDELNTCKSMDLLSEIICKRSCQGKILPDNIAFIGAANPYRRIKQKKVGLIKEKDNLQTSDLVYSVNPMPYSLLSYIFDFGSITPKDEELYIKNIVERKINDVNLIKFSTKLIVEAQNFVRDNNGISSVSLREINRFIQFYEFFIDYFDKKTKLVLNNVDENYIKLITDKKKELSINLSIYMVYYLRLSDQLSLRDTLSKKLNLICQEFISLNFLDIPKKEQNFIADNVDLDKYIARNRALLENLFSLFVCINKKIPIFIIGKPGNSKSLSIQLINNAMRGSSSKNEFFKFYPRIHLSTYQGALNSNSEGVEKIFERARKILESDKDKELSSTILFDEMGLAEHSPHNPLKVIHSNLEYDLNDEKNNTKVSFVGVSNWELDSAKMNRGMTIRIPEPNIDDMEIYATTIAKSYLDKNYEENIEKFFKKLALSYFRYKEEFKNNNRLKKFDDFHGNRDFHHLVQYSAFKINEELLKNNNKIEQKTLTNIALNSFERNFGGLELNDKKTGSDITIKKFFESYDNEENKIMNKNIENKYAINVRNKIIDNLKEFSDEYLSRYLLLITKSNIGIYLLSQFLKTNNKNNDYSIFIGSVFKDDIENEEYTTKLLNKIKLKIEKENILILKNLDSIYTSLYDLFNQNFVKIRDKKYARIALGSIANQSSEVNDKFRCIIIVDEDKLKNQEIPFLNRFEKQSLSFEYIMSNEEIFKAEEFYLKCQNIVKFDKNKFKLINYNIHDLLINCDIEEISGIIYANKNCNYEDLIAEKISATLPQDIILLLLMNKHSWENDEKLNSFYNKILNLYNNNIFNNIKSFLNNYKHLENNNNKI